MRPRLHLGAACGLDGKPRGQLRMPVDDLVLHGAILGMTGSGKTGFLMVLVEEALRAGVPVLMFDVKGDLPNLLLNFPSFSADSLLPWVEGHAAPNDPRSLEEIARALAEERREGLSSWGIHEADLQVFRETTELRVITPGGSAGEPLHILSALERHSDHSRRDPESARAALSAAVSLVLRLLGREADPARSREHVLLSVLAERRLKEDVPAELGGLPEDLANPPIENIGALTVDEYLPRSERRALAAALNSLLASPRSQRGGKG
jgi:DNA helicase HerA-like ATPase